MTVRRTLGKAKGSQRMWCVPVPIAVVRAHLSCSKTAASTHREAGDGAGLRGVERKCISFHSSADDNINCVMRLSLQIYLTF